MIEGEVGETDQVIQMIPTDQEGEAKEHQCIIMMSVKGNQYMIWVE